MKIKSKYWIYFLFLIAFIVLWGIWFALETNRIEAFKSKEAFKKKKSKEAEGEEGEEEEV